MAAVIGASAQAATDLSMWYHGAGSTTEKALLNSIIDDFNASQSDYRVVIEEFPQESYNDSVSAAALAGNLPDIIDVDGPILPNWAWAGYLAPLNLPEAKLSRILPGAIGRWNGEVYAVGLWDAACAIFARRSMLKELGIRRPTLQRPWTRDEFNGVLKKIKDSGKYEYAFDPGMAWTGEWYPYAFGPMLQSAGGDLFDPAANKADGVINNDAALEFGAWWQSLFVNGYAPGTSQDGADRETGFLDGRYALQLNGNWAGVTALDALGDDLVFLPAVDFGNGPKIGAASWQFAVAATSDHKDGARAFIEFAIQDQYMAQFSDGIGLIPPTAEAAAMSEKYRPGGPLEVFFELSEAQATLRAVTPGYVVAAKEFEKAMADISNGADVADALDAAADAIDADVANNGGYR
ncbi:MAG: extracellular solute-binding protein [Betaproteobacteria bacterium AqS2]|uniref:Extracellular solute-binding protein n=1 Tax=Candidatus Amphirhobacter heronislandensis TaxID=1732024 RepID=A0A930UG52_9GAMM|nr:extracellular solute-binding protein [Betaproteobacteria bacterium AqS2]